MKNYFIENYGIERFNQFKADKNELYKFAFYPQDNKIIDKLLTINNIDNFWNDVKKFTQKVTSDRQIGSWQRLAELRYLQLEK